MSTIFSERVDYMTERDKAAWRLYCQETAGSMDVRDFWGNLPTQTQAIFLNKVDRQAELAGAF